MVHRSFRAIVLLAMLLVLPLPALARTGEAPPDSPSSWLWGVEQSEDLGDLGSEMDPNG